MKKSSIFNIEHIQYFNEDAVVQDNAPEIARDFDTLLQLYKTMIMIRTFDAKAIALQRTGKMGTYPSIAGHETISTVIGTVMKKDDIFVPYYRDQATQYLRGVSLHEIMLFWGGDERGNDFKNNKHDFPCAVPIASQSLHATGAAFAKKYQKTKDCVVTTLGDGATSEGDFYEAINVSGIWDLPVVFVIINNEYAISTPLKEQTKCKTLAQKAIAAGIHGVQVDGNDVIALYDELTKAITSARSGKPVVIEAMTYRLCDHTTADDASKYRSNEELDNARKINGIQRLEKYLLAQNIITSEAINKILSDCKLEVDKSVQEYQNTPPQSIDDLFDYMYAETPLHLQEQKQELKNG